MSASRSNGCLRDHPEGTKEEEPRDELILQQHLLGEDWAFNTGYSRRSLVECAFSRLKRIFGGRLRSRNFENQTKDLLTKIFVLNEFTRLGMPTSFPYIFNPKKIGAVAELD